MIRTLKLPGFTKCAGPDASSSQYVVLTSNTQLKTSYPVLKDLGAMARLFETDPKVKFALTFTGSVAILKHRAPWERSSNYGSGRAFVMREIGGVDVFDTKCTHKLSEH